MKISITFDELSRYIDSHYGQQLCFSKVSEKEFCASYVRKILFTSVQFPLNLKIEEVAPDSVGLSYHGNMGIDMIVAGAISVIKAKVPELSEALIPSGGNSLRFDLGKFSRTAAITEAVALNDIAVAENALNVEVSLK